MRKITREACTALRGGNDYSASNTRVQDGAMYLHNNKIAWYGEHGELWVSLCGWNTNTTRERLNGLGGVSVTTRNGQAYLNGYKWNGEPVEVVGFAGNVSDSDTEKRTAIKKRIAEYSKLYTFPYPLPSNGDCWFCAFNDSHKHSLGDLRNDHDHLKMHIGIGVHGGDSAEGKYVHGSMIVNALREHGCSDAQIGVWLHFAPMQEQVQRAIRKYLQKRLIP